MLTLINRVKCIEGNIKRCNRIQGIKESPQTSTRLVPCTAYLCNASLNVTRTVARQCAPCSAWHKAQYYTSEITALHRAKILLYITCSLVFL